MKLGYAGLYNNFIFDPNHRLWYDLIVLMNVCSVVVRIFDNFTRVCVVLKVGILPTLLTIMNYFNIKYSFRIK